MRMIERGIVEAWLLAWLGPMCRLSIPSRLCGFQQLHGGVAEEGRRAGLGGRWAVARAGSRPAALIQTPGSLKII